jgi:hypothetical protein
MGLYVGKPALGRVDHDEFGILTGCGNTRELRVFPGSGGVRQTFGVRIYGFLLCCRARIMPWDRLLA